MPWPEKQRVAIFLSIKRRKGLAAARAEMHKHGYGGSHPGVDITTKKKPRLKKRS